MSDTLNISFVGDLCPILRVQELFISKDFSQIYGDFSDELKGKDFLVANLECPLTESTKKLKKIGPNLKASPLNIEGIKHGGFNVLTLANNHIMDYGVDGLCDTLKICDEHHIQTVGAGLNVEQALKPIYIQKGDTRIAILNFCEDEFSTTHNSLAGTAPIDSLLNYNAVKKAKSNSNYLIVVIHGGTEHFHLPNPFIRNTFRFLAELGADVVIGHHTHCISGFEKYGKSLLFYSLGNFMFGKKEAGISDWNLGLLLNFSFSDSIAFSITPFVQSDPKASVLRYLDNSEQKLFNEKIETLNSTLANDEQWLKEWQLFSNSRRNDYLSRLLACNNLTKKVIKTLRLYKLMSNHQKLFIKNYLNCQSHNALLKQLLNDE